MASSAAHVWRFFRAGGVEQVRLDSAADLVHLELLDRKLWGALSCPVRGLEFDEKTLAMMDTDGDGRLRYPEILAATRWTCQMLKNPAQLQKGAAALPLAAINDAHPDGKRLLAAAKQILSDLGKAGESEISVTDTTDTTRIFAETVFNGDGVILPESASDPALQEVIRDILSCFDGQPDRCGRRGLDAALTQQFFTELHALLDWELKGDAADDRLLPLGAKTAGAFAALQAVRAKITDYFARCRTAAFDSRSLPALNGSIEEYQTVAARELGVDVAELAHFPLAVIQPDQPLPLTDHTNPAWSGRLQAFRTEVVEPLTGARRELTGSEFQALIDRFAAFADWQAARPVTVVEKLGMERLRAIAALDAQPALELLIREDQALEVHAAQIESVDRLVRYHRDLYRLLCNFVNFRDFYSREDKAVFQCGTLYLDQRSCELCVRVEDAGRHAAMAHLSRIYLAYCDCTRKGSTEKLSIAAAFTAGDSDNLIAGRNGVFIDRHGQDWDATITKVIDNPISIGQAFWAPYKRALRWIEEQIAKRAAAADAAATDKLTAAASQVGAAAETGKAPPKPKFDVGVVAALGVAVGGITAALGGILQAFFGLGLWMPLGVVAAMLLISGPSMLVAFLKLRQRNLAPLLDANGWAINSRALISIPFGRTLTARATLPVGSRLDLVDPFAPQKSLASRVLSVLLCIATLAVALAAAWHFGLVEKILPGVFPKSVWMQERETQPGKEATPVPMTEE